MHARLTLLAVCGALLHSSLVAAPETHEIDPVHSSVAFRIKHLFTFVPGRFVEFSGALTLDADKPENSSVKVTIPVASISTANDKRDEHLRSPDFFDAEKFKEITFESKSVKKTGEKTADVTGDLTLHGVTKEVVLKAEFLGQGPGMQGETRSGWHGTTTIKRSDFGINFGKDIEGTPLIGDEVEILLDIEAVKKP